jgi:phosphate transport system protein
MTAMGHQDSHTSDDAPGGRSIATEITSLSGRLAVMGGIAELQLARAIAAIEQRDSEVAAQVVAGDEVLDQMETEINARAMRVLTLHAPVAADLREIVGALKISSNMERIGDYAVNIAKRTAIVNGLAPAPAVSGVTTLGQLVRQYVQKALDAYAERSMSQAEAVWRGDADIDALHTSVFQDLLSDMLTESEHVVACTHLLFVIKNFERIGDHAANIAETIQFLILGAHSPEKRPRYSQTATTFPAVNSVLNRLGGDR